MIAFFSIFAAITGNLVLHRNFNSKQSGFLIRENEKENPSPARIFLTSKIGGFLILGLIPGILAFVLFQQSSMPFGFPFEYQPGFGYLFGLPALIIVINYFLAQYPATMARYPEMRFVEWTRSRLAVLISGWTIYLFGYEFLFRGLLFFSVYHSYGLWVSLAVNTVIYSGAHYPKGKAEMLSAIPFGIVLCYTALMTGSFVLPFLIHLALALSTDFFSIRNNPEMKIV